MSSEPDDNCPVVAVHSPFFLSISNAASDPIGPASTRIFQFASPADIANWEVFTDAELGGQSEAQLRLSDDDPVRQCTLQYCRARLAFTYTAELLHANHHYHLCSPFVHMHLSFSGSCLVCLTIRYVCLAREAVTLTRPA